MFQAEGQVEREGSRRFLEDDKGQREHRASVEGGRVQPRPTALVRQRRNARGLRVQLRGRQWILQVAMFATLAQCV